MEFKEITYDQFKEAIKVSFIGDESIMSLYDENVKVNTVDDIVEDIYKKVSEYGSDVVFKGAYENNELIGYAVTLRNLLISFSISSKFRTKKHTDEFFLLIKQSFNESFFCYLWGVNKRAVKWLKKQNMETIFENNQIIKLKCQLQQV